MAYLLLLALVYSFAIALLIFQSAVHNRSAALVSFGVGFSLLAIVYAAQIALGYDLNDGAARVFYWARWMLALAWFGNGFLLSLFPKHMLVMLAGRGLAIASFLALGLVAFTQITNAGDWFQPANPIYSQIGDLLATNRPTRWLAILLNAYGFAALVGAAIYFLRQSKSNLAGQAFLIISGAIFLGFPLYWSQGEASPLFYLLELITSNILFLGMLKFLRIHQLRKIKRRRAAV